MKEVSQLLWSAQGLTANWGARTAPSAGAFVDEAVKKVLNIKEEPLCIMPVGKKNIIF